MCTVAAKIRDLRSLDLELETVLAIEETSKDFAKLNTDQMDKGQLNTGEQIKPAYTANTIARKKAKGQPFDRVTLHDTGKFYDSIAVQVDNDHINISSPVDYSLSLELKYTSKIFGLNAENSKKYNFGPFWSVFKRNVEHITGLKFT